jgi:phosphate transport system substrate-binding protein
MKSFISIVVFYFMILFATAALAQDSENKVVITGVRFAYPLVEKWIEAYKTVYPDAQIQIESRTTIDPANYDLLIEAYEPDEEAKGNREYIYLARYALLPIANSSSAFAKNFGERGLNEDLIKLVYFHDIYADKKNESEIKEPFTVYTRLQTAGAPTTFARYFGFEQKDFKGKAIAGADEHLIRAIRKDSTGISYGPLSILYNLASGKLLDGITILPVDINGNGKVNEEEKFYNDLESVIQKLESVDTKSIKNIPIEYIHLSVSKESVKPEALKFLQWVANNGQQHIRSFGYLKPESKVFEEGKQKSEALALRQ